MNTTATATIPARVTLPARKDVNNDCEEEEEEEEEDDEEEKAIPNDRDSEVRIGGKTEKTGSPMKSPAVDESESSPRSKPIKRSSSEGKHDSSDGEKQSTIAEDEKKETLAPSASSSSVKVQMKIGESNSAKKRKKQEAVAMSSVVSVSSAIKFSGMDTGPTLPSSRSSATSKNRTGGGGGGPDLSVSAILSARATEAYNEERMKDPQFSMWVPPVNQSGDGKTKLNEKFGY